MRYLQRSSKIPALLSKEFNKYEYLIGEEILPSNQNQMIEQAKFTYSPLGKAFEKQIKTNEDEGEKQIKAIQSQGPVKAIKKYTYDDEDSPLISKHREIFDKSVDERLHETTKLDKKVDHDDLIYRYKGKTPNEKFDKYDNALRNGEIKLAEVKNDQITFKSNLGEIKKGKDKSKNKKKTRHTILKCFTNQKKGY